MKNYFIEIKPATLDELTSLYNANQSIRTAITKAQHRIETRLASDPERVGLYISGGVFRIEEWPLRELYTINPILGEVEIFSISLTVKP